jgi:hypothetical protein
MSRGGAGIPVCFELDGRVSGRDRDKVRSLSSPNLFCFLSFKPKSIGQAWQANSRAAMKVGPHVSR